MFRSSTCNHLLEGAVTRHILKLHTCPDTINLNLFHIQQTFLRQGLKGIQKSTMRYVSYNLRLNPTLIAEAGRASFCMSSEGLLSHCERSANQQGKTSIHIRTSRFKIWETFGAVALQMFTVYPRQIHLVHLSAVKSVYIIEMCVCVCYTPTISTWVTLQWRVRW